MKGLQENVYFIIDFVELVIGADLVLDLSPESVHGIELRGALRQPKQTDSEPPCQPFGLGVAVRGMAIENQTDWPPAVHRPELPEERAEVFAPVLMPGERDELAGTDIQGTGDDALLIPAGDQDLACCPFRHPGFSQGRKEQDIRLVLKQNRRIARN